MNERPGAQSETSQQTRYDRTPYTVMPRTSINSTQNDRGKIHSNERHYARHTHSSRGRAGLHRSPERRTFRSTPSSQLTRITSHCGGRPANPESNRRQSQTSDKTSGSSSSTDNAAELGTSSPGTSVHGAEGDQPKPQTQQEEDIPQDNSHEPGSTNPDPGLERVIEAPTSSPGDATTKANPPPCTCTQQKEPPEKEVDTNPGPAPGLKLPVEVKGNTIQGPTNDGTPSGQPGPASKSTRRSKSNSSYRYTVNDEFSRMRRHSGQEPLKEGEREVNPQFPLR